MPRINPLRSHLVSGILEVAAATDITQGALLASVKSALEDADLTPMGEVSVAFEPYGTSLVVVLKESHVAVHHWPECRKITVDIHVCDYLGDNMARAQALATALERRLHSRPVGSGWISHTLSA